jgi:CheY-like chemotaxis protein
MKILIADDNKPSRMLLQSILKGAGAEILEAAQGREALDLINREHPGLVLLDIEMPFVDGYTILRSIRGNPQLADIKVIAVTANVMEGSRENAIAAGFDGFISKPVTAQTIRHQVHELSTTGRIQS